MLVWLNMVFSFCGLKKKRATVIYRGPSGENWGGKVGCLIRFPVCPRLHFHKRASACRCSAGPNRFDGNVLDGVHDFIMPKVGKGRQPECCDATF
ncbi:hypothetical protein [Chitinilyticum aquatile]|uniref:hypothetical protein n=1 Tax=Chitinilyticum aquatile TaxID=362520 RepID=UPI0012DDEDDE|nr:hypothetical protein [Chitinilyticum aquatile]